MTTGVMNCIGIEDCSTIVKEELPDEQSFLEPDDILASQRQFAHNKMGAVCVKSKCNQFQ